MIDQHTYLAAMPRTGATVSVMRCNDQFQLEPDALSHLFAEMTVAEAEDIVCRVLEDIAQRLDSLQRQRQSGEFDSMTGPARRVAAVAHQIGLVSVALAADHVACAAETQSAVAVGATVARLERAFDIAVTRVWDFQRTVFP